MTPLYLYNGQLLSEGGALAVSENCCCSGECCSNYSNCTFTITENFNNGSSNTAIIKNGAFLDETFLVGSFAISNCSISYSAGDTGSTGENCNFTWSYSKSQKIDCECCASTCSKDCNMGTVTSEESAVDETEGCTIPFGMSGVDISINCEPCCCPDCVVPEGELGECCEGECKNTRDDTGLCTRPDGSSFVATYNDCGRDNQSNTFTLCPENPLP